MIDPAFYVLVGWFGIALALNWAGFFRGPQGQQLMGYERLIASLCWPYVLIVLLIVLAIVLPFIGVRYLKDRK